MLGRTIMSLKVAGGPVTCTVVVEPVNTSRGDVAHRVDGFCGRGVSEGAGDADGQWYQALRSTLTAWASVIGSASRCFAPAGRGRLRSATGSRKFAVALPPQLESSHWGLHGDKHHGFRTLLRRTRRSCGQPSARRASREMRSTDCWRTTVSSWGTESARTTVAPSHTPDIRALCRGESGWRWPTVRCTPGVGRVRGSAGPPVTARGLAGESAPSVTGPPLVSRMVAILWYCATYRMCARGGGCYRVGPRPRGHNGNGEEWSNPHWFWEARADAIPVDDTLVRCRLGVCCCWSPTLTSNAPTAISRQASREPPVGSGFGCSRRLVRVLQQHVITEAAEQLLRSADEFIGGELQSSRSSRKRRKTSNSPPTPRSNRGQLTAESAMSRWSLASRKTGSVKPPSSSLRNSQATVRWRNFTVESDQPKVRCRSC